MDEDTAHAKGTGNGTRVLPPSTPETRQHVPGSVMASGLAGDTNPMVTPVTPGTPNTSHGHQPA